MRFGSWCSGTRLNFAARLGDGELAYDMLRGHLTGHVMPSLLNIQAVRCGGKNVPVRSDERKWTVLKVEAGSTYELVFE